MGEIFDVLGWLASESPLFFIWLLGIIIAIVRWKRHPKVSFVTVLAFGAMSLEMLTMQFVYRYLLPGLARGQTQMDMGTVYKIVGFARAIVHAGLYTLLLMAIFGWRNPVGRARGADGQYLPADFDAPGVQERSGI